MGLPDLTPIDDDEVLTLVLLDSTHPQGSALKVDISKRNHNAEQMHKLIASKGGHMFDGYSQIIAAATELKNSLLESANQVLRSLEKIKDLLLPLEAQSASAERTEPHTDDTLKASDRRLSGSVNDLLKKMKSVVDSSVKLTLELDSFSFNAMNPIWGTEKSARQSRKFLIQLLEKITGRGEAIILYLSSVLQKLTSCSSSLSAHNARSPLVEGINPEAKHQEGSRGRGRGLYPPGSGRGRGLPFARGTGGIGVSPVGSAYDSDSGTSPAGNTPDDAGEEGGSAGKKHLRDFSPDEGQQRRWKKKPPSNVDWMLKCRTKLLELKERTAKKAVSDVFMTERTVQETISFIDHNATKLEGVASKNPLDFSPEDRRVFMQSIESYIAGLERALVLLARETLNKRQLMGLFESAAKVEKLTTPAELLTEMKSIVSLLNTFAYMPKMDDDD